MIRLALVGQPNCGKSTLFNSVAGYKAVVSNFPGTTVDYTSSRVSLDGEGFELIDVPGIYSLSSPEPDEWTAIEYLLGRHADAVINILDASILSRSLELTLELLELNVPLVICLNMMDEAERKGIQIDVPLLQKELGVPVRCTIASRGHGVHELFQTAIQTAQRTHTGRTLLLSLDVEAAVEELTALLGGDTARRLDLPRRLLALKLLERDDRIELAVGRLRPELLPKIERLREGISQQHGRPEDVVISSERHSLAMNLFERVAQVKPRTRETLRDRADHYLMHPFWGYLLLASILFVFFNLVFTLGESIEGPLLKLFGQLARDIGARLDQDSLFFTLAEGLIQGFSGGIAIVLPYLVPFLLGLALLEDIGYLPRAAFLMDSIMHRIGLHGKALFPFVLGYGCSVPAVMAVRGLESSRDRFITAVLVSFIPCAARTTIIFALAAFYLGPNVALSLYGLNLLIISLVGKLLSSLRPEISPGLILEIPSYKLPGPKAVTQKIWFRLREFIVLAWPLLIVGSIVLSLLEFFELFDPINRILSPFTSGVLGLPPEVGITLVFGILRKELSLVMLVQALGTTDFASVMTSAQLLVFTAFTIFYIPCLATLAMLRSAIGNRGMIFALVLTTGVATFVASLLRVTLALVP